MPRWMTIALVATTIVCSALIGYSVGALDAHDDITCTVSP